MDNVSFFACTNFSVGRPQMLCLALAVVGITGCIGKKTVPLAPVSGVVTFDGAAVADAVVTLKPTGTLATAGGREAHGYTAADGRFTMSTDGKPGAAVGTLAVFVGSADANKPIGGRPKPGAKDPKPKVAEVTVGAGPNDITIELVR